MPSQPQCQVLGCSQAKTRVCMRTKPNLLGKSTLSSGRNSLQMRRRGRSGGCQCRLRSSDGITQHCRYERVLQNRRIDGLGRLPIGKWEMWGLQRSGACPCPATEATRSFTLDVTRTGSYRRNSAGCGLRHAPSETRNGGMFFRGQYDCVSSSSFHLLPS